MKKLFLVLVFVVVTISVHAQDESTKEGFKIGAGLTVGFPGSNLEGASVIVGADILAHYGVSTNFAITADAGYQKITAKGGGDGLKLIPIRLDIRYYPTESLYILGKGGIGLLSASGGNSVTTTAYSFGLGYLINNKIDLGASYDGYSKDGSFSIIALRVGYFFGN